MQRRQYAIFSALIGAGIAMFVIAALVGGNDRGDISVLNAPGIDGIVPQRGDEVLQQQQVGIDLAAGYRLVRLTISPNSNCQFGVDVTSQTRYVEGLQQYLFTPGEGQLIEALAADDNCAVAVYEEISRPGETETIDWNFTVS